MASKFSASGVHPRLRPATIVDVAKQAGVSIGTVSRHLNGLGVRPDNKAPIEEAIVALGYRRNAAAASIKSNRSHIVGFMAPSLGEVHGAILEQLTRRMRSRGRAVLSFCHEFQPHLIREALDFFTTHRVDTLIVNGESAIGREIGPYMEKGLVVALYDNDIAGLEADRVFVDNRRASAKLADHLIDLGHDRIGIIHGRLNNSVGQERLTGFLDACRARGVVIATGSQADGYWEEEGGYAAMAGLMGSGDAPTAVFSCNYAMTIGALTWAQEAGVSLPKDVSLVSFDDVPAFRLHRPGITAVRQPIEAIADAIASAVDQRLASPSSSFRQRRIDCDVTLRGSVRSLLSG